MRRIRIAGIAGLAACQAEEPVAEPVAGPVACAPAWPDPVENRSPEEVAELLEGYPAVDSDLLLSAWDDLSALEELCRVGRDLVISGGDLGDLRGLESLALVGRSIQLLSLPGLRSLEGLEGLLAAGDIQIHSTGLRALFLPPGLTSLDLLTSGNAALRSVEGGIYTAGTIDLLERNVERLELPALRAIGTLNAQSPALSSVSLPALEEVTDSLILSSEAALALDAPRLAAIRSTVRIDAPGRHTLPALRWIGAQLQLPQVRDAWESHALSLPALEQLGAINAGGVRMRWPELPALRRVGEVMLESVTGAGRMEGLAAVEEIGSLMIIGTDAEGLDGLSALTSVGSLLISSNDAITTLAPIGQLGHLDQLYLYGNAALPQADLPGLVEVGELAIQQTALEDLTGLSGLRTVTGGLSIVDNPGLSQQEIDEFLARIEVRGETMILGVP